ncbi:MAG: RsmD family RNA methyltransferase, partial [Bacteroidales bacterium]|nr:RsmD family RNA methyltransferase [Bacteroidales bacterium]
GHWRNLNIFLILLFQKFFFFIARKCAFLVTFLRLEFIAFFADPPYAIDGLDGIPDKILERGLLHPGGYFILEHGGEHSFTTHPCFVKERSYGRVHFSFFEAPGA